MWFDYEKAFDMIAHNWLITCQDTNETLQYPCVTEKTKPPIQMEIARNSDILVHRKVQ